MFSRHGAPKLPRWADLGVMPVVNVLVALACTSVVVAIIGEDPFAAMAVLLQGAFLYDGGIGYTLYYATNLMFTGLCVAVAFQAMQFNIGGEGQAIMGGLFCGLLLLALGPHLPFIVLFALAILAAGIGGGVWGLIPGYLFVKRGSHIVITTIMFNFIAAAILQYLLVKVLIEEGQMSPQTESFVEHSHLPYLHEILAWFGVQMTHTPANLTLFLALAAALLVWVLIWRTPWGYSVRTVGQSEPAAIYAGIVPGRVIVQVMFLSGALAGLLGVNALMGDQHRILIGFSSGYGFAGIGVALMGRNHPVGIVLASLLFGVLIQGGSELDFEFNLITRDLVVVVQGLIILFLGALALLFEPPLSRLIHLLSAKGKEKANV